jgi:hypothetical protein
MALSDMNELLTFAARRQLLPAHAAISARESTLFVPEDRFKFAETPAF